MEHPSIGEHHNSPMARRARRRLITMHERPQQNLDRVTTKPGDDLVLEAMGEDTARPTVGGLEWI